MATWAQFAEEAPMMAEAGRRIVFRTQIGKAQLATVRGDDPPRIHPIYVEIVNGHLMAFMNRSAKATDLAEDGRYALHAHQDQAEPHEFMIRGRVREIDGPRRTEIAATWSFETDETYRLFEFLIDHAVFGERASAEEWPPRYTSWRDPGA